jgi:leucyl aminopeptidase
MIKLSIKSGKNDIGQQGLYLAGSLKELAFSNKQINKLFADKFKDKQINAFNASHPGEFTWLLAGSLNEKSNSAQKEAWRKQGAQLLAKANAAEVDKLYINSQLNEDFILSFLEGLMLASYRFDKYLGKTAAQSKMAIKQVVVDAKGITQKKLDELNTLVESVFFARDLVNETPAVLTAKELSKRVSAMAKKSGVRCEVLNEGRIKALRMNGIINVNRGSVEPPTFTILEYKPEGKSKLKPIVLVGKGIVYDTGGLNIKVGMGMADMKCDMAGAATVAATVCAAARLKLPVHLIALIPATDNRPSGNAYAAGDVIEFMNGVTAEVLNTDAEGRLILADALCYASRFKPSLVIDFATLTGAAAAAIGKYGIVCMGTADESTKSALKQAGDEAYERLAEFPFWDEYHDLIKSKVADIKNIGGPVAGAITAGKFLEQFTDYPWMHMDIAGPAFIESNDDYKPLGGTGVGVRLMIEYFKNQDRK